jgi:hypothetical protein
MNYTKDTFGLSWKTDPTRVSADDGETWEKLPLAPEKREDWKYDVAAWLDRALNAKEIKALEANLSDYDGSL